MSSTLATTWPIDEAPHPDGAIPLIDFIDRKPNPNDTLLGERFLCRAGGMLFVGPSGIGKSSASTQMDLSWSIGRPAFGITPQRPLKILLIQAENDAGDLNEMISGIAGGMALSTEDKLLCRENLLVLTDKTHTGTQFLSDVLAPALEQHRPDIVRIDPLLAYLGADPTDTAALSQFCRAGLNPLLTDHDCACILNHHTPKTTNRDTSKWRPSDWMYSGAGAAELANWPRAVLVVEPTATPSAFRFIAAKRGARIGWRDNNGKPLSQRIFCHTEGSIAWRTPTSDEEQSARTRAKGLPPEETLLGCVPEPGLPKTVLLSKWNDLGIGEKKCTGILSAFVNDGKLFAHDEPRPGTRPMVMITRRRRNPL